VTVAPCPVYLRVCVCCVCVPRCLQGVDAARAIAAVDGVDVLFIGPTDLGVSLAGEPLDFDDARLVAARRKVVAAAKAEGKAAGILCGVPSQIARVRNEGFTFVAVVRARGLRRKRGAVVSSGVTPAVRCVAPCVVRVALSKAVPLLRPS
jgi:2-keto-3-deoxy-L-rhamnonate aldolase RhmA